jgi:rhodanese-related sulfurtransferase
MDSSWILVLLLGVVLGWFVARTRLGKVAPEKARALVADGALLLDVRSPTEFSSGHITGARNVPLSDVSSATASLAQEKKAVVVYCQSGMRSATAAGILRRAGIEVYDLGAMSRWA